MDSVWEQWDLVCADPGGCDTLDQLMRAIVWAYVLVAWMIFFAALRPWTTDLPKAAGTAVAAAGSALIVWISIGVVGSSGSLRFAIFVTAVGLVAVWIGRPAFTERKRPGNTERKRPGNTERKRPGNTERKRPGNTERKRPDDEVNADASPTSSRH